jgi:hypothetical protein
MLAIVLVVGTANPSLSQNKSAIHLIRVSLHTDRLFVLDPQASRRTWCSDLFDSDRPNHWERYLWSMGYV